MLPSLARQRPIILIAAAKDLCLLSIRGPQSATCGILRTSMIPSSPANGISPCIVVGELPRKVSS